MGSQYHTIHHTHYIYNYGQIFIIADWLWGTLAIPMKMAGEGGQELKIVKGILCDGRKGGALKSN